MTRRKGFAMVGAEKEVFLMRFAENLMALRKRQGWSQEELGGRVGVTRQTVSKWEVGQSTPELEKLVELSRLFGVSIDRLVGLEEPEGRGGPWEEPRKAAEARPWGVFYEYVSSAEVFGLPLVHIRWGMGPQVANGIVANGNYVMMIVHENCDDIVNEFNALF